MTAFHERGCSYDNGKWACEPACPINTAGRIADLTRKLAIAEKAIDEARAAGFREGVKASLKAIDDAYSAHSDRDYVEGACRAVVAVTRAVETLVPAAAPEVTDGE